MSSELNFDSFFKVLEDATVEKSLPAVDLLIRCTSNIINNPNEAKYRRLKIGSREFMERLIPVKGALECLFFAGFVESSEHLIYPEDAPVRPLCLLHDDLVKFRCRLELKKNENSPSINSSKGSTSFDNADLSNNITSLEREFLVKITTACDLVQLYEDKSLQDKARSLIPVDTLSLKAKQRLSEIEKDNTSATSNIDFSDCLLIELLTWFKNEFFSWFHTPVCRLCEEAMTSVGHVESRTEETRWGGSRVEGYECAKCATVARFPRYSHPEKLLETKVGRCGEWANCFTLCCKSLGFEARYVLDWTDHVWTEVYSKAQGRWLHCDPCENVCDSPLLYECGWNKKLTYVLAFSTDDIQDVTWRYSCKHGEVLQRRSLCREHWLLHVILDCRKRLQYHLEPARKMELDQRLLYELVEFLSPRTARDGELGGRVSGGYDWRRQRGEVGLDVTNNHKSVTLFLTADEMAAKQFHLKYCAASDRYVRPFSKNAAEEGWLSCVYEVTNVFRKVEPDWKQVYLARSEGSAIGSVSWKVSVPSNSKLRVSSVCVKSASKVYENGVVCWEIRAKDKSFKMDYSQTTTTTIEEDFKGEQELNFVAELSGGKGDVSWQHAQLFRQPLSETEVFPFEIHITYK